MHVLTGLIQPNGGEEGHRILRHITSYSRDECFGGKVQNSASMSCHGGTALVRFSPRVSVLLGFSSQCFLLFRQYNTLLILKKRKELKLEFLS